VKEALVKPLTSGDEDQIRVVLEQIINTRV
jgi:hypothetical protein